MNAGALIARLRQMEGAEMWFRARATARVQADLLVSAVRTETWQRERLAERLVAGDGPLAAVRERLDARDWHGAHAALLRHFQSRPSRFPVSARDLPLLAANVVARFPRASATARRTGERLLAGRFDLLGYRDLSFTSDARGPGAIDWHVDPVSGRRSPGGFWSRVRYLDPTSGDHKVIWELNRHQHWLALGRAAWLTEESAYRDEFVRQLEDWLQQNPPQVGINWASSLELSLRSLSWLWALHLFTATPGGNGDTAGAPWTIDLLLGIDRQLSHVAQNLSRYFSPNTHLTGEALGLYACGCALPELAAADGWTALGRAVLLEEIERQLCADGGHVERSPHYHRYTLDYYILAAVVARLVGDPAEEAFAAAVHRAARAARQLADDCGRVPNIGDEDGGQLFPICGRDPGDLTDSLAAAAVLLDEPSLAVTPDLPEATWWLLGADAAPRPGSGWRGAGASGLATAPPESCPLPDTGYYISRKRPGDHVVIDGGPHGYLNGGHAHADALALTATLSGQPLFVDPGTFTYTMSARLRDRFRSTAMHNTITIDGRPQSLPSGPFGWKTTANATVRRWMASAPFDYFEGIHDGYLPLQHVRRVAVLADGTVVVVDSVCGDNGNSAHEAALHWHAAPGWAAVEAAPRTLTLQHLTGSRAWLATSAARLELFEGDEEPGLGWTSPVYGSLVASTTLRASLRRTTPFHVVTAFGLLASGEPPRLELCDPPVDGDEHQLFALRLVGQDGSRLVLFGGERTSHPPCADGVCADARFAVVERDEDGRPVRVAVLDGSRVWDAKDGRDLLPMVEIAPAVRAGYRQED